MNANICFLFMVVSSAVLSACAHSSQPLTWQERRLEQPTELELQWERSGHVMIYEGMTDREVELALDKHFDRVQSMMFVNTVVTNDNGDPVKDPESGEVVTEDDGCN